MKLLVESTGPHAYMDMESGCEIQAFRPSVVSYSNYLSTLMAAKKVKLLSNEVQDSAEDVEFLRFYVESSRDKDLAVQAFLSKFGSEAALETATPEEQKKAAEEAAKKPAAPAVKPAAAAKE